MDVRRAFNRVRYVFDWIHFPDYAATHPFLLSMNDVLRMYTDAYIIQMFEYFCIWQNGSSESDVATGVAVGEDGSIVIGGYREDSSTYFVVKLDAGGTFVWQSEVSQRDWWQRKKGVGHGPRKTRNTAIRKKTIEYKFRGFCLNARFGPNLVVREVVDHIQGSVVLVDQLCTSKMFLMPGSHAPGRGFDSTIQET